MKTISQDSQFIAFQLHDKEYAIPISLVRSIEREQVITRVPHTPDFIEGIIHLRGEIIPVIDLNKRLDLPMQNTTQRRIILLSLEEEKIGVLVDAANDVINVPISSIEAPHIILGDSISNWITGIALVGSRVITLLNLEALLLSDMTQHRNEGSNYVLY